MDRKPYLSLVSLSLFRGELKGRASMYELQSGNSKVKDEALIAEEQRSPTSRGY